MRVHELAKELQRSSKELIEDLRALGVEAKNHMSALESTVVEMVRKKISGAKVETNLPPQIQEVKIEEVLESEHTPLSRKTQLPPRSELKKILEVSIPLSVRDFAELIGASSTVLIAKLIDLGEMLSINDSLKDEDMISLLGSEYDFEIHFVAKKMDVEEKALGLFEELEKPLHLVPRAPVVTFMGHVDHGKTSLLDQIRKSNVVNQESGGITQHIGAYQINFKNGKITFLDTPGHEAFTLMRARGASVTDIVILVIAADDGVMPQTLEALNHCKAANVPIIVALNKMDKPNISADKTKRQLSENGLLTEDWGGQTIVCEVSAKTGDGIQHLLEMILLQAEMMELKADPTQKGKGIVVESELTKGRGPTATILVRQGTFKIGDAVVCGVTYGRIKALLDDQGKAVKEAGPATPIVVLGLSEVPEVGLELRVVKNDKIARQIAELRLEELKKHDLQPKKMTLEDMFQKISSAAIKELRVILKADVKGSLEALDASLAHLKSDQITLRTLHSGVGDVSENDVMLASASGAIIIAFHVKVTTSVRDLAKREGVDVRSYSIIYEIVDDIRKALEGMLSPLESEVVIGHAKIQKVFELSRSGKVAGCMVSDGRITRSARVRVVRSGETIHEGMLQSLKRFKDEVKEVREGFECGVRVGDFEAIEEGDTLEFFEIEKTAQKLQ